MQTKGWEFLYIKACINYFFIFHRNKAFKKSWKMIFIHQRRCFCYQGIQILCNFPPSSPTLKKELL